MVGMSKPTPCQQIESIKRGYRKTKLHLDSKPLRVDPTSSLQEFGNEDICLYNGISPLGYHAEGWYPKGAVFPV